MFMAGHMDHWIHILERSAKACQGFVLCGLKGPAFQALQFDADGVVVAIAAPPVTGHASVPGPMFTADKLPQLATSPNIEMRGHLDSANLVEIGMGAALVGVFVIGSIGLVLCIKVFGLIKVLRVMRMVRAVAKRKDDQ